MTWRVGLSLAYITVSTNREANMTTVTIDLRDLSYAEIKLLYKIAKTNCNEYLKTHIEKFVKDNNYSVELK